MSDKYVCPCGMNHISPSMCPQDYPEYLEAKLEETGYPGYPSTSQQDEIYAKSHEPGMYTHTYDPAKVMEINDKPAVWVERIAENKVTYEVQNIPHEQAMRIIQGILPKVMELYLEKSKDYPDWPHLGVKGEFVEIWRKTHKLKRGIWEGQPMASEPVDEILMDMVAHCLLALDSCPDAIR